jgi:hypothetical protein
MSTTTDLPAGVSDTFTFTCPCEATVHVAEGVEQPHDCPLSEAQRQALRDVAAAEQEATAEQPQGVDPLQLASMLLVNANNVLAKRGTGVPVERQIALAQAIATVELAQATRLAYQLNREMAQLAVNDRNAAIAKQAGPAGIVIPHLAPQGR